MFCHLGQTVQTVEDYREKMDFPGFISRDVYKAKSLG